MDFSNTSSSDDQLEQLCCSEHDGHPHTITDQPCITTEIIYHHSPQTPQQPPNYKRQSSCDGDELPSKKFKADEPHHQISIIIPIMANRLLYIVDTYSRWRRTGFDIQMVFSKDEEEAITSILQQHAPDISFVLHPYMTSTPPNAGIAKNEAYRVLQRYLDQPNFKFALLLDDTVNDIIDTCTGKSIMTNPTEFHHAVIRFAQESPVFGGTVAYKRHPEECKQEGIATVNGGFLQQALIYSCRGTPALTKHFQDIDDYVMKMRRLYYRRVPFGEDVSFQVALYEHEVLSKRKSPQFWGLGISRMQHKSTTKRPFDQLDDKAKEALKDMLIYLNEQKALSINPRTNELRGVKVIPQGRIHIPIKGNKGERPWREAFKYTFTCNKENNKELIN